MKTKNVLILVILIFSVLYGCNRGVDQESESNDKLEENAISYDTDFISQDYIDSNLSENFDYDCNIVVNSKNEYTDNTSIDYSVNIIIKDDSQVYPDILATCKLNDSTKSVLSVKTRAFFGIDTSDHVKLDSENRGVVVSLSSWIEGSNEDLDKEKILTIFKEPLFLKVSWGDQVEYVMIKSEDIHVEWK